MSNPFIELDKIYKEELKRADEKNTADLYKESFCYLQKVLKEEYHKELTNIEYLDGYFLFASGTNSVVHFDVKGCKHWKFGIWWSYDNNVVKGEFFCQHERYLDKFKPSRGTYTATVFFGVEDNHIKPSEYHYDIMSIWNICLFIKKHLYVAAMKDFHGYDYNTVAQRPVRAFFEYYWDGLKKHTRKAMQDLFTLCLKNHLNCFAKKEFAGDDWEIIDNGDCCSPRYELQVRIPDDDEFETGCYGLFSEEDDIGKKSWDKKVKLLEKISDIFHVYWSSCEVSDSVIFWKQREYEENLKEWEEREKTDAL